MESSWKELRFSRRLSLAGAPGNLRAAAERTIPQLDHLNYTVEIRQVTSARYAPRCAYNTVLNAIKSSDAAYAVRWPSIFQDANWLLIAPGHRVATDGDLPISRCVCNQRARRWKEKIERVTARAKKEEKKEKKKKRKKNQFVSAIPNAIPVFGGTGFCQTVRCRELHFPANMCDRGHARHERT